MNIADRIQHLRKVKGISQEELANQIGVSRQSVSKWETEQLYQTLKRLFYWVTFLKWQQTIYSKVLSPLLVSLYQRTKNLMVSFLQSSQQQWMPLDWLLQQWYGMKNKLQSQHSLDSFWLSLDVWFMVLVWSYQINLLRQKPNNYFGP